MMPTKAKIDMVWSTILLRIVSSYKLLHILSLLTAKNETATTSVVPGRL